MEKDNKIYEACKFLKEFAVSNSGKLNLKLECRLFRGTNFSKNTEKEIDNLIEKKDWLELFENNDWLLLLDAIQNFINRPSNFSFKVNEKLEVLSKNFLRQTDKYICPVLL